MSSPRTQLIIRAVQRGVRWLKENAEALVGGLEDTGIVISALVAAERNPHSHLVQRLVAMLLQQQRRNGSWNEEVYDTYFAVKALYDVGYGFTDPPMQAAFRFLEAMQDPVNGTWYEEPGETAMVLDLVARLAPERIAVISERPLRWLESLQKEDGSVIGVRYTGMIASLFCLTRKVGLTDSRVVIDRAIEYIRRDLQDKSIWTGAAWSNYYSLQALLDSGYTLDDPLVIKAVDWFLGAQDTDGKWLQVSRVHDTSNSVLALCSLLTTPLIDISEPQTGVLIVISENGTMQVSFQGPGAGAIITSAVRVKISPQVRADLSQNQQIVASALGQLRSKRDTKPRRRRNVGKPSVQTELEKVGQYAYGQLVPPAVQYQLQGSPADHLRLDMDERLIDLPWELMHDGTDFLCLQYAVGRRLVSRETFVAPRRYTRSVEQTRVLVVADPTNDLPAARREGRQVASLLRDERGMDVDEFTEIRMTKREFLLSLKDYDVVHFAGHASHQPKSPDESCMIFADGELQAFEISGFLAKRAPAVVFLNACWSAEELSNPNSYSPMMRGLGRTFLYAGVTAFLGYLVPVPDESATQFAVYFYQSLVQGQTIGESLRRARIQSRTPTTPENVTWSSAVLYGDPAARAVAIPSPSSL